MGVFNFQRNLYESKAASGVTSECYRVVDATELTLFIRGQASVTTVQFTNHSGLTNDLTNTTTNWSNWTVFSGNTIGDQFVLPTGFQYIRCLRSLTTEVMLSGLMRT